jgi:hypothetical protein
LKCLLLCIHSLCFSSLQVGMMWKHRGKDD